MIWIASYSDVDGKEQTDKLADDMDLSIVRTDLECFISLIKTEIHLQWQSEWIIQDIKQHGPQMEVVVLA